MDDLGPGNAGNLSTPNFVYVFCLNLHPLSVGPVSMKLVLIHHLDLDGDLVSSNFNHYFGHQRVQYPKIVLPNQYSWSWLIFIW
jgi:hypothetical protein